LGRRLSRIWRKKRFGFVSWSSNGGDWGGGWQLRSIVAGSLDLHESLLKLVLGRVDRLGWGYPRLMSIICRSSIQGDLVSKACETFRLVYASEIRVVLHRYESSPQSFCRKWHTAASWKDRCIPWKRPTILRSQPHSAEPGVVKDLCIFKYCHAQVMSRIAFNATEARSSFWSRRRRTMGTLWLFGCGWFGVSSGSSESSSWASNARNGS